MKPEFDIEVRPATYDDLPDVVRVNIAAWRDAYVGRVPQDYLDNLDFSQKLKEWQGWFASNADGEQHLDLAVLNNELIGFIAYGRGRDEGAEGCAEIYAAYLLKDYWGMGVGYTLFQTARKNMIKNGYAEAYLWVLMENYHGISAYQKWGGIPDPLSVKEIVIYDRQIQEIAVKFPQL